MNNPFCDLFGRTNEIGFKAVIILNEILERRFSPVAFAFRRGFPCIFNFVTEGAHCFRVGLFNNFVQHILGFLLGLTGDDEGVDSNLDRVAVLSRLGFDVGDLGGMVVGRVAVCEVPI